MTARFIATHPLASRHRLAAARRFLGWQFVSRLRDDVDYDWIAGAKLKVRRGMNGATGNIYCGLHEFADMAFLMHLLRPGDRFVDVGANVGSYTVLAAAVCGATTLAVEPDPDSADRLRDNVRLNNLAGAVTVLQAALGARDGVAAFSIGRDTCNQVTDGPGVREVAMTTLDAAAADLRPTLVKLDVEGYETSVIAGATRTLAAPELLAVLSESDDPGVHEPLRAHGFSPFAYDAFQRRLTPATGGAKAAVGNHLFLRAPAEVAERLRNAPRRRVVGVEIVVARQARHSMCGINGVFAYHYAANTVDVKELARTREHMAARGPDARGEWLSPDRRVGFGHRRLAIIDLDRDRRAADDERRRPLRRSYSTARSTISRSCATASLAEGRRFRGRSDTEVLLQLYAAEGPAMVGELRGMFAFAIFDAAERTLFLARDPLGVKPLYYADDGWTFRFASQVKALLAGGGLSRDADPAGEVGFYLFGHVPEPFTTHRAIRALPAGATLTVDRARRRRAAALSFDRAGLLRRGAAAAPPGATRSRRRARRCSTACATT